MSDEKKFEWNDELIAELLWSRFPFPEGVISVKPILEEFKKSKTEVKPIVEVFSSNSDSIYFKSNVGEGIIISKERLAEILIAESKGDLYLDEDEYRGIVFFNSKELLEAENKAFNAGRSYKTLNVDSISNSSFLKLDYKDFSDYKNNSNG